MLKFENPFRQLQKHLIYKKNYDIESDSILNEVENPNKKEIHIDINNKLLKDSPSSSSSPLPLPLAQKQIETFRSKLFALDKTDLQIVEHNVNKSTEVDPSNVIKSSSLQQNCELPKIKINDLSDRNNTTFVISPKKSSTINNDLNSITDENVVGSLRNLGARRKLFDFLSTKRKAKVQTESENELKNVTEFENIQEIHHENIMSPNELSLEIQLNNDQEESSDLSAKLNFLLKNDESN